MRTSCDIDLLVPEPELDAAVDALRRALGYRRKGRREYHDVGLLAPSGVHLELHFNILENTPALDRVLGRVWDYIVPTGEGSALRETPEFYLFHHLAHMAYHLRTGGCGVRPFLDLWLLERRGGYDAAALDALLAESGLTDFAACARALARRWLEGAECGALEARTEEFVLAGGVYGVWDQKIAVEQERAGGRLGYLRGRLWMPYDGLIHIFPWLRSRRWLTPLTQALRWTKLFRRGILRRVRGEVALNRRLDPEKRRTASELMRDLGIL